MAFEVNGAIRRDFGMKSAFRATLLATAFSLSAPLATHAETAGSRVQLLSAFAEAADGETMARYAAGPYWTEMSDGERSSYVDLFRRHLVGLIADLLPNTMPDTWNEGSTLALPGGGRLITTSLEINGEQTPVGIQLSNDETPRIVDLTIDLTSLKRAEVMAAARQGGVAAVLERLGNEVGGLPPGVEFATASKPVPAPVPAPPSVPVGPSHHVVYFDSGSTNIVVSDEAALAAMARSAAAGSAMVRVVGHSDPQGSLAANASLSQARAERVAGELVAAGFPSARISIESRGENAFAAPGPDPRQRRVEIDLVLQVAEVQ